MKLLLILLLLCGISHASEDKSWQIKILLHDHGEISFLGELVVSSQANKIARITKLPPTQDRSKRPNPEDIIQKEIEFNAAQDLRDSLLKLMQDFEVYDQQDWDLRGGSTLTIWLRTYAQSKAIQYSHNSYQNDARILKLLSEIRHISGLSISETLRQYDVNQINGEQGGARQPATAVESKSEGKDKTKPEPKRRSQ